ncbi:MAG: heavy metal-binding domain-containing protein, partial [Bacteroidota bacterium]
MKSAPYLFTYAYYASSLFFVLVSNSLFGQDQAIEESFVDLSNVVALDSSGFRCPPCNLSCDTIHFAQAGTCPECGMTLIPVEKGELKRYSVAFYLQNRVEVLDFAGPMEVFAYAGFEVFTVSKAKGPIKSQG